MKNNKHKIACLCGSLQFKEEFADIELRYVICGWIVLTPCCMYVDAERTDGYMLFKQQMDEIHLEKIDIANEIFVINKDGYIGESTRNEIEYAKKLGKPIRYLEPL